MTVSPVLDAAGRRRSPATMPGYHTGRPPRNKGRLYPADPSTVEEIVAVMRAASDDRHGCRLRAMIVVLWRGGLRVQEALALGERDLDPRLNASLTIAFESSTHTCSRALRGLALRCVKAAVRTQPPLTPARFAVVSICRRRASASVGLEFPGPPPVRWTRGR
jgi:integrase